MLVGYDGAVAEQASEVMAWHYKQTLEFVNASWVLSASSIVCLPLDHSELHASFHIALARERACYPAMPLPRTCRFFENSP
jgi:hypothetical protein